MRAPARRRRRAAVALCAAGAALVAACTPTAQSAPAGPAERVEVFTWWASGSEKLAFDAVTSAFASQHPDIRFVDAAVGGGAGSTAKDLLWSRLATGQPPDTFQVHGGAGLQDHVRSHDLRPLDDLARELGLGVALAPEIAALVTVDGVK
jgi:glucose/mannose transport system substrate-binding protein